MPDLTSLALAAIAAGGLTTGRARSLASLAAGLIAVILAVRALRATAHQRRAAAIALVAGIVGVGLAVLHLVTAQGAIGTGSGKLGAIVALVLSAIANFLGWLAYTRGRRST